MDVKTYLASLPAWDGQARLDDLTKEQVLAAEIALPVPPGWSGVLAAVVIRRPYCGQSELVAVDVSRLPAS